MLTWKLIKTNTTTNTMIWRIAQKSHFTEYYDLNHTAHSYVAMRMDPLGIMFHLTY